MQSAHVASRSRTYLAAQYRRIAARRGKKRATMAVAHSILVIADHVIKVIKRQEPYQELGAKPGLMDLIECNCTWEALLLLKKIRKNFPS